MQAPIAPSPMNPIRRLCFMGSWGIPGMMGAEHLRGNGWKWCHGIFIDGMPGAADNRGGLHFQHT